MLRGASAEALAGLPEKLGTSGTLADSEQTGSELFGVVRILRSDAALRRFLTDGSLDGQVRTGLAETVFGTAVSTHTLSVVRDAASRRWTVSGDLPDVLEQLAVVSTVRSAGKNAKVGDELFAVRRMIDAHPELRSALSDQSRSVDARSGLLAGLLDGKALPATALLVREAVSRGRGTIVGVLEQYLELAAQALDETVATVHTARDLTDAER